MIMIRFSIFALLAFFLVGAAQAQVTLVSNSGQTRTGHVPVGQRQQSFTTGDNTYGYDFHSIVLHGSDFADISPNDHDSLQTCTKDPLYVTNNGVTTQIPDADATNVLPCNMAKLRICRGTGSCDNMSQQRWFNVEVNSSRSTATLTLDRPLVLQPESRYIVLTGSHWGSAAIDYTNSDNEDAGGASGWSISNTSTHIDSSNRWELDSFALKITVKGTVRTSFRSTPTPVGNNNTPNTPPVNPPPTVLSDPENLQANFDKSTSSSLIITLSWNAVQGATDYEYKIFEGGPTNKVWPALIDWTSAGNVLETDVSLQSAAEEFTIWVRAKGNDKKSDHTQIAVYDVPDISSLSIVVTHVDSETPFAFALSQNYPNPFNPATTIRYELPAASEVRLAVYDLLGREVSVLFDGLQMQGAHTARFDATGLPSGSYVYRFEAAGKVVSRVMTLSR